MKTNTHTNKHVIYAKHSLDRQAFRKQREEKAKEAEEEKDKKERERERERREREREKQIKRKKRTSKNNTRQGTRKQQHAKGKEGKNNDTINDNSYILKLPSTGFTGSIGNSMQICINYKPCSIHACKQARPKDTTVQMGTRTKRLECMKSARLCLRPTASLP